MDASRLSKQIASLPGASLIGKLAQYQNSTEDFISPDFELIDQGDEASIAWFDSDRIAASQFAPFAQSHDGGLFAFWRCEACTPIVYLASDGEGSQVIAQNASQLLSLIAFGSSEYSVDIEYIDQDEEWDGPDTVPDSLIDFREWLRSELSIEPAESPLAIIKAAKAASPDLMSWIRKWQSSR